MYTVNMPRYRHKEPLDAETAELLQYHLATVVFNARYIKNVVDEWKIARERDAATLRYVKKLQREIAGMRVALSALEDIIVEKGGE